MLKKVAIQGIAGSYHHEATDNYFGNGNYKLIECDTFRELTKNVANTTADYGIMAIENTIAGTILTNYALISKYKLTILGEIYMPIHHHLMGLKGQDITDIVEIQSHPMALLQCENYFELHPSIKIVESVDTALSAKLIAENKLNGIAGIASKKAAEIYDLAIINDDIQINKENFTRFFILTNQFFLPVNFNKASLKFTLPHQTGSLVKVLEKFSNHNINMTKIQSLPIINKPWEYEFYVDIVFDNKDDYAKMKAEIILLTHDLTILGKYMSGNN